MCCVVSWSLFLFAEGQGTVFAPGLLLICINVSSVSLVLVRRWDWCRVHQGGWCHGKKEDKKLTPARVRTPPLWEMLLPLAASLRRQTGKLVSVPNWSSMSPSQALQV